MTAAQETDNPDGHQGMPLPGVHALTIVAGAFAAGVAVGQMWQSPSLWSWLGVSFFFFLMGAWLHRHAPYLFVCAALAPGTGSFGAAYATLRIDRLSPNDLAAWVSEESHLIRLEGVAMRSPTYRRSTGGSLAAFDYRPTRTLVPLSVTAVLDMDDNRHPMAGRVLVRVSGSVPPFRAGDAMTALGYLVPIEPARNPGEFDRKAYAQALGQAGTLMVPNRDLVTIEPAERTALERGWMRWREQLQRRARGLLLARLPEARSPERDALLRALLLGEREPDLVAVTESFQRVGVAHLLAISGLHLGILAGMALLIMQFISGNARWHAWALIALVLAYLALIEVRMPVLRAAAMTIIASLGLASARRWQVGNLVALSGILLLLWRPDQIFSAGFQLTFGIVLGLIHLTDHVLRRIPIPARRHADSTAEMVGQWLLSALAVAITSWLIATPIVMFHFGFIALAGIFMSIPGVLLVAALLFIGYLKLILEVLLPSAAMLIGLPLAVLADLMLSTVMAVDRVPHSVHYLPFPSASWTFAALGFVCLAIVWRGRKSKRTLFSLLLILATWLYWPSMPWQERPALRLDILAVGHGACYLVRSGGETFLFDAGSITNLDIGRQIIIPALRRLGVRRIDTLAISHPHIDHYAAAIELADEFSLGQVLVTHQFIEHAHEFPHSPVAFAADGLTRRFVPMQPVVKDDVRMLGDAQLTWLHPPKNLEDFSRDNEHSMVVRIDIAGRTIVLTGDVERQGLAELAQRQPDLRSCVVEIPHHGSFSELAAAFVTQLEPQIAFQSSSRTQWQRDRWGDILDGVERLITHRDGACWIEISASGEVTFGRFLERDTVGRVPLSNRIRDNGIIHAHPQADSPCSQHFSSLERIAARRLRRCRHLDEVAVSADDA